MATQSGLLTPKRACEQQSEKGQVLICETRASWPERAGGPALSPPGQPRRTQCHQDVAQLGPHHHPIALLVEDSQPFHKVLEGALLLVAGEVLQDGEEGLKVQHLCVHFWKGRK